MPATRQQHMDVAGQERAAASLGSKDADRMQHCCLQRCMTRPSWCSVSLASSMWTWLGSAIVVLWNLSPLVCRLLLVVCLWQVQGQAPLMHWLSTCRKSGRSAPLCSSCRRTLGRSALPCLLLCTVLVTRCAGPVACSCLLHLLCSGVVHTSLAEAQRVVACECLCAAVVTKRYQLPVLSLAAPALGLARMKKQRSRKPPHVAFCLVP